MTKSEIFLFGATNDSVCVMEHEESKRMIADLQQLFFSFFASSSRDCSCCEEQRYDSKSCSSCIECYYLKK